MYFDKKLSGTQLELVVQEKRKNKIDKVDNISQMLEFEGFYLYE